MNKLFIALLVAAMLGLTVFFFWPDIQGVFGTNHISAYQDGAGQGKEGKKKKRNRYMDDDQPAAAVRILQRWELPKKLVEISGIAFTGKDELAAIQDEDGIIFTYNLSSRKITREVPFAGHGDYEGIAVTGSTAWVMKSDGILYEVANYTSGQPVVTKHRTGLTAKHDVEALTYDQKNNRLLMAFKSPDENGADYKGIYAFNLATKQMVPQPVVRIPLNDPVLKGQDEKKRDELRPSDMVINPANSEFYVLEGTEPKLAILNAAGKPEHLYKLNRSDFPQPEGIGFNEAGELFISNEGAGGKGTILKVALPPSR